MNTLELIVSIWVLNDTMDGSYDRAANSRWRKHRNIEDGLIEANYAQGTSRYSGAEARLEVGMHRTLWLISKVDYVRAELSDTDTPLPRIPPLRGIVGLEATYKGFRLYPEVVMADHQRRLFPTETSTAGYAVFNLTASYTLAQQHVSHIFSVNTFNVGDMLYRNHLSFIKEFAPEIGARRAVYLYGEVLLIVYLASLGSRSQTIDSHK